MEKFNQLAGEVYKKYTSLEQNPDMYMEGLVYARPVTYWDYIEVDTLLSLQKPRTVVPDEMVFIMYHQLTEILFKLVLSEVNQIADNNSLTGSFFSERMERVTRYFDVLTSSFAIMKDGMDVQQYLKFRTTLTPASGFQSAQYRVIEFSSTDAVNLVDRRFRDSIPANADEDTIIEHMYWQAAGKDFKTGKKSLTLQLFEEKYRELFRSTIQKRRDTNLYALYRNLPESERTPELKESLRKFDLQVNVHWPMAHFSTAEKYLESGQEKKEATGGSDWKKYMLPKYQKRIFFPGLWSAEELENWG